VIFQNPDDEALFTSLGLTPMGRTAHVAGSGVDLVHYAVAPLPEGPTTFVLVARLLRGKGIFEYVEAASRLKKAHGENVRFLLVGPLDPNPSSVARKEVEAWAREGVVEWRGELADVRPEIARSHVFVLPSYYREGVPHSILEAMSMGRAIITTDTPGCRETVKRGANGFLVPPRETGSLADAMLHFVDDPVLAVRMGAESRRIAVERFDVNIVNPRMLGLMGLSKSWWGAHTPVERKNTTGEVAPVQSEVR
jgi:glycosyltransferase involved in cell wall biosynthesis